MGISEIIDSGQVEIVKSAIDASPVSGPWHYLNHLPLWGRMLVSVLMIGIASVLSFGGWTMGMLMLAFSMDGVRSSDDLPGWLEPGMLIGWPVLLGMAALVPWLMFASGFKFQWSLVVQLVAWGVVAAVYVIAWIAVVSATGALK